MENDPSTTVLAVGIHGILEQDHPYDENLLSFYSGVYGREHLIPFLTQPTRHVSYECYLDNGNKILFSGCEVTQLEHVPAGMVAWEIGPDSFRVRSDVDDTGILSEASIHWEWKENLSTFGHEYVIGDFTAAHLTMPFMDLGQGPFTFCFSENTFIDYAGGSYREEGIALADPDDSWPAHYDAIKDWLGEALGPELISRIEHYGSTAIPGIPAKPVIDVLVEIPSFEMVRRRMVPLLCSERCSYSFFMNHVTFTIWECLNGRRTHHIHMAPKGHAAWDALAFRDYLCASRAVAKEYADLKRQLSEQYPDDRNRYIMGKEEFVRRVTRDALEWKARHAATRSC